MTNILTVSAAMLVAEKKRTKPAAGKPAAVPPSLYTKPIALSPNLFGIK